MTNKRLMDMTMSELDQAIDGVIAKYPGEPPPENVLGGVKLSLPPPQVRKNVFDLIPRVVNGLLKSTFWRAWLVRRRPRWSSLLATRGIFSPPPQFRKKFTRAELIALARRIQDS